MVNFVSSAARALFDAVSVCHQRKKWAGPSCTCAEFRDLGHCKHLDMFLAATQAAEEYESPPPLDKHSSVPGLMQSTLSRHVLMSSASSMRSLFSGRKAHPSVSSRFEISTTSTYSEVISLPDDDIAPDAVILPFSASRNALANSFMNEDVGVVRVPRKIRQLSSKLTLLDNVGRSATYGRRVYRAANEKYGIVQVKVLRCRAPTCLPDHNETVNNELEILQNLDHPNVVRFFGYQEALVHDNVLERRVAFEFAVDSLSELVAHRATGHERLTYLEVRKYAMDVAEATVFLHQQGVVHRDLSSDNVVMIHAGFPSSANWTNVMRKHFRLSRSLGNMFRSSTASDKHSLSGAMGPGGTQTSLPTWRTKSHSGKEQPLAAAWTSLDPALHVHGFNYTAKLANFEVAKRLREPSSSGAFERTRTTVTSPQFRSPEAFRGDPYDETIDVWSFGCILYEMLAREQPFYKHYTLAQIEEMVTTRQFPPRGYFAPSEFRPLEKLMHTCLAHDPSRRPGMDDVLAELRRLV